MARKTARKIKCPFMNNVMCDYDHIGEFCMNNCHIMNVFVETVTSKAMDEEINGRYVRIVGEVREVIDKEKDNGRYVDIKDLYPKFRE